MFGGRDVACVWREGCSLCLERERERDVACVWREGSNLFLEREGSNLCLERGK